MNPLPKLPKTLTGVIKAIVKQDEHIKKFVKKTKK